MRGGKFLNNWRMAQLHAQEAPERVRELEQWGALFDRTEAGNILQRAFGGHTFKRLCHVGDRTGLEMIRTLQDRGVHLGIDVYMECTITRLLKEGDRIAGAFGYWREQGRFVVFRANRSSSVLAASARPGRSPRTPGNTPATAWRSPTTQAPTSWTWSSYSFIPPVWFGRRACKAFWSPKQCEAKAAFSVTRAASDSWIATTPKRSSFPPAM